MSKKGYHHGHLRDDMITEGLLLLNQYGTEGFSLRKVAAACGVSQTATYKHFANKEDLIDTISQKVLTDFEGSMQQIVDTYPDDPLKQTIEIGKGYVQFMVENPEYLKFIFFSGAIKQMTYENQQFLPSENESFEIFKKSATELLTVMHIPQEKHGINILTMWSVVHGLAMLLTKQTIVMTDDYLELVETILGTKLQFQ